MAGRRKPAAGKKPAAGGGGCLSTLLFLFVVLPLLPLIVFVWICLTFAAGIAGSAFSVPRRGGD